MSIIVINFDSTLPPGIIVFVPGLINLIQEPISVVFGRNKSPFTRLSIVVIPGDRSLLLGRFDSVEPNQYSSCMVWGLL